MWKPLGVPPHLRLLLLIEHDFLYVACTCLGGWSPLSSVVTHSHCSPLIWLPWKASLTAGWSTMWVLDGQQRWCMLMASEGILKAALLLWFYLDKDEDAHAGTREPAAGADPLGCRWSRAWIPDARAPDALIGRASMPTSHCAFGRGMKGECF
jgi:hypothetical protein